MSSYPEIFLSQEGIEGPGQGSPTLDPSSADVLLQQFDKLRAQGFVKKLTHIKQIWGEEETIGFIKIFSGLGEHSIVLIHDQNLIGTCSEVFDAHVSCK